MPNADQFDPGKLMLLQSSTNAEKVLLAWHPESGVARQAFDVHTIVSIASNPKCTVLEIVAKVDVDHGGYALFHFAFGHDAPTPVEFVATLLPFLRAIAHSLTTREGWSVLRCV